MIVIVSARREAVVCIAWQIHLPGDSLVKSWEKHVGFWYGEGGECFSFSWRLSLEIFLSSEVRKDFYDVAAIFFLGKIEQLDTSIVQ